MFIRELVRGYLASDPVVRDREYARVPVERLHAEFQALRRFLSAQRGKPVALALQRDYRYFLALLACMEMGVPFVPLRAEWPLARVEEIRAISGFEHCLRDEDYEALVHAPGGAAAEPPAVSGADLLYCMFTSGTTGAPKGVMIPRGAYENFLRWCGAYFRDIGRADRLLNSTDFTFDVSLAEVALVLTRQCEFISSRFRDDLFVLLGEMHAQRATIIATVPNNFSVLLDPRWIDRADLTALRHALIAGSRFPVALASKFRTLLPGTRVYNCYGPTEATIYCLARELDGDPAGYVVEDTVSVGRELAGCAALVVGEDLTPLPEGTRGELLIGGRQVMAGYMGDPAGTARVLVDIGGMTFYRTGDIAFRSDSGDYFVCGRNDDTVKVSGQRVNLSDVDGYVQRQDFVRTCATIAVADDARGAMLVLYVVPSREITRDAAYAALASVLPRHQLPHDIRFMDELPLNNSGKISKSALVEMYRKERSVGS